MESDPIDCESVTAPGTADAFRVQAKDGGGASDSKVVYFTPLAEKMPVPPQFGDTASGSADNVITGFFPGGYIFPDENGTLGGYGAPLQNIQPYRSRLLDGNSSAELNNVVRNLASLYRE